jgi:Raf kinase inhibitor-like YbhB/YbcL family protein
MSVSRSVFFGAALATAVLTTPAWAPAQPAQGSSEGFRLRSPSFEGGDDIPTLYTCDGNNTSPPLVWSDPPRPAKAFMLVVNDVDANARGRDKRPFVHWIIYNVAGDARSLGESLGRNRLPGAAREGTNDFKREGYDGPCPPPKSGAHHYVFTLYALDATLDVPFYPTWPEVEGALGGHVMATTTLEGTYDRAP